MCLMAQVRRRGGGEGRGNSQLYMFDDFYESMCSIYHSGEFMSQSFSIYDGRSEQMVTV